MENVKMSLRWGPSRLLLLAGYLLLDLASCGPQGRLSAVGRVEPRDVAPAPLLQCIQVAPPVRVPAGEGCKQVLMSYSFANSYNKPFVGLYQPPACPFNRVTFNLTVLAAGRQFDRLAVMYLNDTEVFRTSTAEPTANGIIWTYIKDMSNYLVLFKQSQKVIFDLGNIVDSTYTSPFNATLVATFYNEDGAIPAADLILPVSARKSASNAPSAFNYPETNATDILSFPRNIKKAVFSISACGQIGEEFWWSNVLSSNTKTFSPAADLYGYSPFRELQLYIDGSLAGVAWPFPIIFTGGVVPGFWRPIVGIDAFDLREDEIDITPWLPLLADGQPHTFSIRVAGIDDNGRGNGTVKEIGSPGYWVVTGKVFLWLDKPGSITTGTPPVVAAPAPQLVLTSNVRKGARSNSTLAYSVQVQRQLSFTSTIVTSDGSRPVRWEQDLYFENVANLSRQGDIQYVTQRTHGVDTSSNGYSRKFNYPLYVYSNYTADGNKSVAIDGNFDRGKEVQTQGQLSFPNGAQTRSPPIDDNMGFTGSDLRTRQNGSASYFSGTTTKKAYSYGTTEQDLTFAGLRASSAINTQVVPETKDGAILYQRHILAVNGSVVLDTQSASSNALFNNFGSGAVQDMEFAAKSIRQMLGRGPFG